MKTEFLLWVIVVSLSFNFLYFLYARHVPHKVEEKISHPDEGKSPIDQLPVLEFDNLKDISTITSSKVIKPDTSSIPIRTASSSLKSFEASITKPVTHSPVYSASDRSSQPSIISESLSIFLKSKDIHVCSPNITKALQRPQLSADDFGWCKWALTKGGVVVGSSWGKLAKSEQKKFDQLNCNLVGSRNKNPSCAESWGDAHVLNWRNDRSSPGSFSCQPAGPSRCLVNENGEKYCTFINVQIDFSKQKGFLSSTKDSPGKRSFEKGFFSLACNKGTDNSKKGLSFGDMVSLSSGPASSSCDITINQTVLMYSHDNIRNAAHTLNDIMNVMLMLWIEGVARNSKSITMLNIDSLKL
jgi:hypothetical protein